MRRQKFSKIYSVVFIIPLLAFVLFVLMPYSHGSAIVDGSPGPGVAVSNQSSGELLAEEDPDFNKNLYDNGGAPPKEKCVSCGVVNLCLPAPPAQRLNQILNGRRIPSAWTVRHFSDYGISLNDPIYAVQEYPGDPGSLAHITQPRQYTNDLNSIALDHYNRNQIKLGDVLGTLLSNNYSRHYIIVGDTLVKWVNPKYVTTLPSTPWSQQAITVLMETGPDNRVSRRQIQRLANIIHIESPSNMFTVDLHYLFDVNEPPAAVRPDSRSAQQATAKIANIDEIRKELCLLEPPPPPQPPRATVSVTNDENI